MQEPDGTVRDLFKEEEITAAVRADFTHRLESIWAGRDPVHWKEGRRHPLILASDALEIRYGKMADFVHSDTEEKLRVLAPLGLHLIEDGLRSTLSSMLIDKSAEVGRKERQKVAPNGWKDIIADQGQRFATIKSHLSDTLIAVDPEKFRDLKWVNFEDHMPSIFPDSSALASPDADRKHSGCGCIVSYAPPMMLPVNTLGAATGFYCPII